MVDLGLSYEDFLNLIPYEVAMLHNRKIQNDKIKYTYMRNAFMNGYVNANRGKKDKFIPLFEDIDNAKKKRKIMSPEEVRKARDDFFNIVKSLEGGV